MRNLDILLVSSLASGDEVLLENVFQQAKLYGNFKVVYKLMKLNPAKFSFPEFKVWFKEYALKNMDLLVDRDLEIAFFIEEDVVVVKKIVKEFFSKENFWLEFLQLITEDQQMLWEKKELFKLLASGELPEIKIKTIFQSDGIEEKFSQFCEQQGIQILKCLQKGQKVGRKYNSYVYLVLDNDGIIKIYKELLDYSGQLWQTDFLREDQVYEKLPTVEWLPKYYGKVQVAEKFFFLKQEFKFSQTLQDYLDSDIQLSLEQAGKIIFKIAQKLQWLLDQGLMYLDLKPANILFDGQEVGLIDFGLTAENQDFINLWEVEPEYLCPETELQAKFSERSLVYQLGIIFSKFYSKENEFINKMLEVEAVNRLALLEVLENLRKYNDIELAKFKLKKIKRVKDKNTVIFPARMGIPHKGHIEYISRLLYLGFYVKISIHRSYTITQRDPIPKWLVMKMVAQSLLDKGFTENDFEFIFTPYYDQEQAFRLHFAMIPGKQDLVGVASGNIGVYYLFPWLPIFDQKKLFGVEGEDYEIRSWGEFLRKAVRANDYQVFQHYAASGVEKICSFQKLQQIYGKPEIEFIDYRKVEVVLLDESGTELVRGRVFRYMSPEENLKIHLQRKNQSLELIDPYTKNSLVKYNQQTGCLKYLITKLEEGKEIIYYQIIIKPS